MKNVIIIYSLLVCLTARAQLYDAQWAIGYNESVVDFRSSDSVHIYTIPTFQLFVNNNASICDEEGNLLYYTNGVSICGVNNIMANGTGLCPNCSATDSFDGLSLAQLDLFIPKPGSTRYYYLFHCSLDTFNDTRPGNIYYSLIDKEADNGRGAVVGQRNILPNHPLKGGGITACKHANGRDYWLIAGASDHNLYYKFLITPNGVLGPYTQNIGLDLAGNYDVAYSKFSPDGSKYAIGIFAYAPIEVMDFDRCSGEFSNPIEIFNNVSPDTANPASGGVSVEFSPNNRFLYISCNTTLRQYDIDNIHDSVQLYLEDTSTSYGINFLQLAPNGKIYGSTWNGGLYALHVINRPDQSGDSANFVYGGQPTYSIASVNLPNLINYRLGPLVGSGCDTISTDIIPLIIANSIGILPNPANKYAYVEIGMQGDYEFDLLNENGQVIDKKETRQVDIFDMEQLSGGVYFVRVIDKTTGAQIAIKKVVVAH